MKALLFSILLLFSIYPLHAQQIITASDMPEDNDTARYSNVSPFTNIDFENTGTNYVWDFSNITATSQDFYEYKNAFEISLVFVPVFGLSAFGRKTSDGVTIGPVNLDNLYTFYESNSTSFKTIGRSLEISGIPAPAINTDDETIYKLPLKYGNTNSDNFELSFPDVGVGILYTLSGTRSYVVDGWGTIITPYDTFECIRVKSTIEETNELEIQGFPLNVPQTRTEYTWLSKGIKTPVFEVGTQEIPFLGPAPTYIRYKDTYQECLINRPTVNFSASDTVIYTTETVQFSDSTICGGGNITWNISPSNGVVYINGTNENSSNPEVQFNTEGFYSVSLTERNTQGPSNLRKTDYIEVKRTTSIANLNPEAYRIYPNPCSDWLEIKSKEQINTVELFALDGKKIFSKKVNNNYSKIELPELESGLYLLSINQRFQQKIVVNQ